VLVVSHWKGRLQKVYIRVEREVESVYSLLANIVLNLKTWLEAAWALAYGEEDAAALLRLA
jgi:hypothetical protein